MAAARLYELQVPLERPALRAALELAAPTRDDRLLDLATGTGALLHELAASRSRPDRAVGLDADPTMLARVPGLPAAWRLVEGDARALPFAASSFDVVVAAYLLHLLDVDARLAVLGEVVRVLRAGGRLVTVTVATDRPRLAAILTRLPIASGLRALDPRPDLAEVGLAPRALRLTDRGYPSLCLLAERP